MIGCEILYDRSRMVRRGLMDYLTSKELKLGFYKDSPIKDDTLYLVPDGYLPVLAEPVSSYRIIHPDGKTSPLEPVLKKLKIPYGPSNLFLEWRLQKDHI